MDIAAPLLFLIGPEVFPVPPRDRTVEGVRRRQRRRQPRSKCIRCRRGHGRRPRWPRGCRHRGGLSRGAPQTRTPSSLRGAAELPLLRIPKHFPIEETDIAVELCRRCWCVSQVDRQTHYAYHQANATQQRGYPSTAHPRSRIIATLSWTNISIAGLANVLAVALANKLHL